MSKMKICSFCNKERRLWYSNPPCCSDYSCKKLYAESKSKTDTSVSKTKKVNKISHISDKRKKELSEYRKERGKYMNDNPICEACNFSPSTEIHHQKGKIGKLLYNPLYFLAVCRPCHNEIENNPEWAKENEYSIDRL